jgi:hypothetical protein
MLSTRGKCPARWVGVAAAIVALSLGAAHSGLADTSSRSVGLRNADGYGPNCSAELVTSAIRKLVAFANAGMIMAADRLVAPEPIFEWFSAPGATRAARRLGPASKDRATLRAYLRERHRHHERLTLEKVMTGDHALGNFGLILTRRADDYPLRRIDGKGAAVCNSSRAMVFVWSLGG